MKNTAVTSLYDSVSVKGVFDNLCMSICNTVLKDPFSFSDTWWHLCSMIHTICIKQTSPMLENITIFHEKNSTAEQSFK